MQMLSIRSTRNARCGNRNARSVATQVTTPSFLQAVFIAISMNLIRHCLPQGLNSG